MVKTCERSQPSLTANEWKELIHFDQKVRGQDRILSTEVLRGCSSPGGQCEPKAHMKDWQEWTRGNTVLAPLEYYRQADRKRGPWENGERWWEKPMTMCNASYTGWFSRCLEKTSPGPWGCWRPSGASSRENLRNHFKTGKQMRISYSICKNVLHGYVIYAPVTIMVMASSEYCGGS
jgi:hypothetical protein